jgi:hypothetical protein
VPSRVEVIPAAESCSKKTIISDILNEWNDDEGNITDQLEGVEVTPKSNDRKKEALERPRVIYNTSLHSESPKTLPQGKVHNICRTPRVEGQCNGPTTSNRVIILKGLVKSLTDSSKKPPTRRKSLDTVINYKQPGELDMHCTSCLAISINY